MSQQHLNSLSAAARVQDQSIRSLQHGLHGLQQEILAMRQAPVQPDRPRQIEDIPGLRTPRWYVVEIEFAAGETGVKFNSAEIAPDGPFIITQCAPWWLITDTTAANFNGPPAVAPTGRTLPCSAVPLIMGGSGWNGQTAANTVSLGTAANRGVAGGILGDVPEFSFQVEVAGSGRYWTNTRVPAADFYGWGGQPNYLGIQGWVERTDRINIHATPEMACPHAGTVRFVLQGYQILGPVNVSDYLGA